MTQIGMIKPIDFLYIESDWSFKTSAPAHIHVPVSIASKLDILQYLEISRFIQVGFFFYLRFQEASLLQTLLAITNSEQQLSGNTGDFHILN